MHRPVPDAVTGNAAWPFGLVRPRQRKSLKPALAGCFALDNSRAALSDSGAR